MNFRRFFLWVFIIILIHTAVLACFFRDRIIQFKLLSSASISISRHVAGNSDQQAMIEELEKMWQEKLIEDLFRGTAAVPSILVEETLDQDEESPTTHIYSSVAAPNILVEESDHEVEEELEETESGTLTLLPGTVSLTVAGSETAQHDQLVVEVVAEENRVDDTSQQNPDEKPEEAEFEVQLNDDAKLLEEDDSSKQGNQELMSKSMQKPPKMVIVLTQSRHGSTWLMDILGYRDEAVPVFEPLNCAPFLKMYALSDEIREETLALGYDPVKYEDWRDVLLTRICTCDWHGVKIPGKNDKHYGSIRGLWYKEKRLNENTKGPFNETTARDKCKDEGSMMVPKTIRYYNMSTLYRIRDFGCENFKVIHLVRDPRAVMTSRMTVFSELYDGTALLGMKMTNYKMGQFGYDEVYMARAADWMCSHHLHNYKLGMNPPPWLRDRYKMVRYEDLAEFPQHWARELLHFIGVKYTQKYKEYVYNLTHVKDRGKKDGGWYGVERQSSEIVDSWKKKLIEPHWKTIERVCADMMKAFNYKPTFFNSED